MSAISGSKKNTFVFRQMEFPSFPEFFSLPRVFLCWQFLLWLTTVSLRAVDSSKVVALPPQGGNVWAFCGDKLFWAAIRAEPRWRQTQQRRRRSRRSRSRRTTTTTNFFEPPSEPSYVEDKHGKVSSPCLQRLPLSSYHNSATTSHNPAKVTILKKLHFNRISVSLFGCYFSARRQVWRVLANVCYFSRTLVAGRWVDGEGEDRFNIIIISPSSYPASPHHPATSQFSCCAALSSGGIPSYQTKCIRTFSLQIWKFLWPLCLKFWFQSSKQWSTSCSKGCC